MPWTWVQSLVRELRSLKLRGTAGKKRKEKKFRKPEQNPEVTSINFNGLLSPFFPLQACIELFLTKVAYRVSCFVASFFQIMYSSVFPCQESYVGMRFVCIYRSVFDVSRLDFSLKDKPVVNSLIIPVHEFSFP